MWTDFLTPIRIACRSLLMLFLLVVGLVPCVLCQSAIGRSIRFGNRGLDERMLNWWSGMACRVFGVKPEVTGKIRPGPVLIVANHVSWLDIEAMHSVAAMGFVGKAEIKKWPLFGFLATRGGIIYHQRGNHDSSSDVVQVMHQRLKEGQRVAIFPEGGIMPGEQIARFHARFFRVAVEADCPVQPVMIRYVSKGERDPDMTFINGENFMTNFFRLMGKPACSADLRFLQPIRVEGRRRRELADMSREMINQAYED